MSSSLPTSQAPSSGGVSVLVFDFGSQLSKLIVRRLRGVGVYSELISCEASLAEVEAARPAAVILSGGPSSVYEEGAPHLRADVWSELRRRGVPILGICYGMQELVHLHGGRVVGEGNREFGKTIVSLSPAAAASACASPEEGLVEAERLARKASSAAALSEEKWKVPAKFGPPASAADLFYGVGASQVEVWMSHGDKVENLPPQFQALASTESCPFVAAADPASGIYALQFHPEVTHTPCGETLLRNFALRIAKLPLDWSAKSFLSAQIKRLRETVGDSHVVGALSGGVDSTVAAALLSRAVGNRFHGILIDTGLLRKNEASETLKALRECFPELQIECIDASKEFFEGLAGVTAPEQKRKIIGKLFVEAFERAVKEKRIPCEGSFLLQGTLYPDVIESTSFKGPSHTIKTHHNVGGLPERMQMEVLEPLRELFKVGVHALLKLLLDEVRELGRLLGLPEERIKRHPFPGPGLAVRILGEVNRERARILQEADAIFIEEIRKAGLYDEIGQAFAVLLPDTKTVGVMGDCRTYEATCALRAVQTSDFMTADWFRIPHDVLAVASSRITNEVRGINRVVYDISSKPPATIEWE